MTAVLEEKIIEGMGKDVEVVANKLGGKQSNSPYAFHLIDPEFLNEWYNPSEVPFGVFDGCKTIEHITNFMKNGDKVELKNAIFECSCLMVNNDESIQGDEALFYIAKVLKEGAEKYAVNNWRLIPQEDHINHAIAHFIAYSVNDKQDDHLEHCMCRLMMAYSTEPSKGFYYTSV